MGHTKKILLKRNRQKQHKEIIKQDITQTEQQKNQTKLIACNQKLIF
jgi:hypothetical protein